MTPGKRVIETVYYHNVLQSLEGLMEITARQAQGPAPSFERAHVLLAFMVVGENGIIGRQALAIRTGLKEGSIRTIIKKLREDGYIGANASGCHLTTEGKKVYVSLLTKLTAAVLLNDSKLAVGASQVGIAIRGGGKAVQSGIEQRDSAIKSDASGATTYVFRGGKFAIPGGSSDCEKDFPSRAWVSLREELKPRNGDAIIVCGASDETTARLGALSAALTLL
jgi:Domain of unknown function (DUF4443)/CggR N-terminal DNA binding domain